MALMAISTYLGWFAGAFDFLAPAEAFVAFFLADFAGVVDAGAAAVAVSLILFSIRVKTIENQLDLN